MDNIIANGNKMQSPSPALTLAGAATSAGDRYAHARIGRNFPHLLCMPKEIYAES